MTKIINFSIIAHIDHGKSTLAKSVVDLCGGKEAGYFDNLALEKERGITIKSKSIRVFFKKEGVEYQLNMIDTPGHSDFSYEVSKALYACDFAILLVDATKGVQAQTISNAYKALEQGVDIIPVVNKIDLASAQVDKVTDEIASTFGFSKQDIFQVSAKSGKGVSELLNHLIELHNHKIYKSEDKDVSGGLIFDSYFDPFLGVIAFCLVKNTTFKVGDKVYLHSSGESFDIKDLGYLSPSKVSLNNLSDKEVGFIVTGLKELSQVRVGDTLKKQNDKNKPFPGFKKVKPLVFLGIYARDSKDNATLRKGLEVLNLTDSSFTFDPESLGDLGYGFRCGFLGVLHADIIIERLKREFDVDVIVTTPSVPYKIKTTDGELTTISSPRDFPDVTSVEYIEEPLAKVNLVAPNEYLGRIMELLQNARANITKVETSSALSNLVVLDCIVPLAEIIVDFNDRLKSLTSGMGSFDYEFYKFEKSDIIKLDILINNENFSPLSALVHRSKAEYVGRMIVSKLKDELPRKQFAIPLQASIGGKIIARETIKAYRKDVTAKLYGGDRTRKDKLLKKQKEGKKRMEKTGRIEINKDTFLKVIKSYG